MTDRLRAFDVEPPSTAPDDGGGGGGPTDKCPDCGHLLIQKPYKPVFLDRVFDRIFNGGRPRPAACHSDVHGASGYTEDCGCEHPRHGS